MTQPPCDRCKATLALYDTTTELIEGYEHICAGCMTPAELLAFGMEVTP